MPRGLDASLGIPDDNPCNYEDDEKHEAKRLPGLSRPARVIGQEDECHSKKAVCDEEEE